MTTYSAPISEFEYKKHGAALITPSDTEGEKNLVDSVNGLRVRFIQANAAGVVVFAALVLALSVSIRQTRRANAAAGWRKPMRRC